MWSRYWLCVKYRSIFTQNLLLIIFKALLNRFHHFLPVKEAKQKLKVESKNLGAISNFCFNFLPCCSYTFWHFACWWERYLDTSNWNCSEMFSLGVVIVKHRAFVQYIIMIFSRCLNQGLCSPVDIIVLASA